MKFSKKRKMSMGIGPLSIEPFQEIGKFEELPYLKEEHALFAISLGLIGVIFAAWQIFCGLDPWAKIFFGQGKYDFYLGALIVLLVITARIAWKQWRYYYEEHGKGKEGIFKKTSSKLIRAKRHGIYF